MMRTKVVAATPDMAACRMAMVAAMQPYADKLGGEGMLAVASALVGQLVAMQDQRVMTPAMAMAIVAKNIESANQEVLTNLAGASAGSA